ncbi:AEC family transporter [Ohtaekwangia kribbensis]|jgi:predicted permease|uniref:AEC family transporter n=1 Tax=Ohtaekwangia kribbensis TaxID=688913 RepID=A0ABW3KCL7_9BACT
MSSATTKTISLLLLIIIGYLFRKKIKNKDQREGIKTLILSLALPATIFIALLQIDFKSDLIIIPILSLGFNIVMHILVDKLPLRPVFGIPVNQYRVLIMLIPSLAPGLSCFPFIMEYSGQGPLAMAALADVGNKIFVLIISYTIAMKWYFEANKDSMPEEGNKVKDLLFSLLNEPVNLVIVTAIIMLSMGLSYSAFPEFIRLSIDRLSLMMTPLVLLFIGLSMRLTWDQVRTIFSFLFFRSGIAFLISGLLLFFFPVTDIPTMLLIVVFPQSACSFWPYAHMASVAQLESKVEGKPTSRTFDLDFAMNVLACSMPFSVILILAIYASGNFFTSTSNVFICAGILLTLAVLVVLLSSKAIAVYKSNAAAMKITPQVENTENAT